MKFLAVLGLFSISSASPFSQPFSEGPANQNNREQPADSGFLVGLMSEELIETLRILATDRVFRDQNMDEAIQAIQEDTRRLEDVQPNLDSLKRELEKLRGLTDEAEVLRQVDSIFQALEPLLKKITPSNPSSGVCSVSTDRTQAYLQSLAVMMHELDTQLSFSPDMRGEVTRSGVILSTVTSFLQQLISHLVLKCISEVEALNL